MQPAPQPGAQPGHPPHGGHGAAHAAVETAIEPCTGWHCSHFFYTFDRPRLATLTPAARAEALRQFAVALDPAGPHAPTRIQPWIVAGHKADFGVMVLDPNPFKVDAVHQRLMAGPLGEFLLPTYSFVSLTEVSEYVPTIEQYGRLRRVRLSTAPHTRRRSRATRPVNRPCGRPGSSQNCHHGPTSASIR